MRSKTSAQPNPMYSSFLLEEVFELDLESVVIDPVVAVAVIDFVLVICVPKVVDARV